MSLFKTLIQGVFLHGYTVISISKTTKRLGSLNLSPLEMTLVLLVAHVLLKPVIWNPTHHHSKKGAVPNRKEVKDSNCIGSSFGADGQRLVLSSPP